jgi:hypothetical protein
MSINIQKLQEELDAAGIDNGGCSETGIVWDVDGSTEIQSRPDVAVVIAAHIDDGWYEIRAIRKELFKEFDWTQKIDAVLTTQEKLDLAEYLQALRDINNGRLRNA